MTWTRVLVGAVLAAVLGFAPAASAATQAGVSGAAMTVTGDGSATSTITVTLPGSALDPPCDLAPCLVAGKNPTPYEVHDPAGAMPLPGCTQKVDGAYPGGTDPSTVTCPRGAFAWNAFTVTIHGNGGNDTIRFVAPLVVGDASNTGDVSWINGGDGDDTISGSENDDWISGGAGADVIDGDGGADVLTGWTLGTTTDSAGVTAPNIDHSLGGVVGTGNAGTDSIYGGGGADIITDGDATPTADLLSGFKCGGAPALAPPPLGGRACPVTSTQNVDVTETDFDELFWGHRPAAQAITVDTQVPTPTQGATGENESISGMRGVHGSAGNDVLKGHDNDVGNILNGNAGNDNLDGRGGNDEMLGGDGADVLLGGSGGDFLNPGGHVLATSATSTTVGPDGADTVDGGADGLTPTDGSDSITYSGRSDDLTLNLNVTTGWGGANENDTVVGVENVTGGHGADLITARPGIPSAIESDPIAPEAPHPGEPVLPSPPPSGYYSNDRVEIRNGASDTVDCGGDATDPDADTVIADRTPADTVAANCEVVDLPPLPPTPPTPPTTPTTTPTTTPPGAKQPDGSVTHNDPTRTVKITGSASSVKVKKDGSFTLSKLVITCPTGNKSCSVKTIAATYGTRSYSLKGGTKGATKGKLSKKGYKTLKKRKKLKATVTIRVVHNSKTTTKKVKVTFKR